LQQRLSKTLATGNEILVRQVEENLFRLNVGSVESGNRYADNYEKVYNYSLACAEVISILDSAESMETLQYCSDTMQIIAQNAFTTAKYQEQWEETYFHETALKEDIVKGLSLHQASLVLKSNILLQENQVFNFYLNKIRHCRACYFSYKEMKAYMEFAKIDIAIECGTHWTNGFGKPN
jgi:putative cell wall-binding protein